MAKTPLGGSFGPRRGVSIKGRFYTVETPNGVLIKRWPRRQPTPRSQAEADNRALLAKAARFTAYMSSRSQEFAREVADRSKLLPRDLLMIALFNRLGYVVQMDGRKIYAMVAMQDVSALLDALGQVKGDTLFRSGVWWERLPIGEQGDVLTVGPDDMPIWSPAAGGGAAAPFLSAPVGLNPTISGATFNPGFMVGLPVFPPDDVTINGINVYLLSAGSGRQLQGAVYASNGLSLGGGTLLGGTPAQTAVGGLNSLPFTAPVDLTANTFYWLCFNVTGGSGNVQPMRMDQPRDNYMYFTQSTTTLPSTAGSATAGTGGSQFTWWAF